MTRSVANSSKLLTTVSLCSYPSPELLHPRSQDKKAYFDFKKSETASKLLVNIICLGVSFCRLNDDMNLYLAVFILRLKDCTCLDGFHDRTSGNVISKGKICEDFWSNPSTFGIQLFLIHIMASL